MTSGIGQRAAYVGILTPGSTSRMRAECLRDLTPGAEWTWVDTDPPLLSTSRIWRSLAYRHQSGKAVDRINATVMSGIVAAHDLIWVDKAVFLRPPTMQRIREMGRRILHFTPDLAFGHNQSRHFESSLPLFDVVVTTKSFEVQEYAKRIPTERICVTTQGYDPRVHYPRFNDAGRRLEAVFVGLAEPDRERSIATLLNEGVPVRLAGRGWSAFARRWDRHPGFVFEGDDCFGSAYAELLSKSWIALGLVSKRFPELHTTRTFEIPACGAVLATESNAETTRFFDEDEALFFAGHDDLAGKVRTLLSRPDAELEQLAQAGRRRVMNDSRDYPSILSSILSDSRIRADSRGVT